ncbi:MAG: hypothetical protein CM15mP128_1740 [Methanobacteriota archaeon]|nr:MAG: hypothetical protein CM15mP128_1740 [Euryarchaeota archaeon]
MVGKHGVVDGTDDVGADDLHVHPHQRDGAVIWGEISTFPRFFSGAGADDPPWVMSDWASTSRHVSPPSPIKACPGVQPGINR